MHRLTHQTYLRLAAPFIAASISLPMLGAVGTAMVGRLNDHNYISAVALGAVIFSTIYWLFGFLRLMTSSFSAQALGRADEVEAVLAFLRPLMIAAAVGCLMIVLRVPIIKAAMWILKPEKEVEILAGVYFKILIWGAPFVLGSYVCLGWLMGRMKMRAVLFIQIFFSALNCLLILGAVHWLGLDVDGVAWATLITQILSFGVGLLVVYAKIKTVVRLATPGKIFNGRAFKDLWSCNFYLIIRTVCMLVMVNTFMARSAGFGGAMLAANAILFQLQYIMGDVFDGLASASGVFSGLAVGEKNRDLFYDDLRISACWAVVFSVVMSLGYALGHEYIAALFTDLPEVLVLCEHYWLYLVFFPPLAAAGIVYYGIFNGALKTKPICQSMLMTLALFIGAERFLVPLGGNDGLWLAFLLFYAGRSGFLLMFLPTVLRRLGFAEKPAEPKAPRLS